MILTFLLQPAMVPSFVQTFTLDLMVVLKALASSLSNLPTMLVTLSNNSTAMTGKAALSRYVKTVSLARDPDLVEVVSALEVVDLVVVVSALEVVDLVVGVGLVVDLEEAVVDSEVAMVEQLVLMEELVPFRPLQIPLPTMPLLGLREARPSTFAM
jgi:hypothetical protein